MTTFSWIAVGIIWIGSIVYMVARSIAIGYAGRKIREKRLEGQSP